MQVQIKGQTDIIMTKCCKFHEFAVFNDKIPLFVLSCKDVTVFKCE